ncbi:MAG: hypothetical protein ACJA1E_001328 [Paracoccaceae bacterium]
MIPILDLRDDIAFELICDISIRTSRKPCFKNHQARRLQLKEPFMRNDKASGRARWRGEHYYDPMSPCFAIATDLA